MRFVIMQLMHDEHAVDPIDAFTEELVFPGVKRLEENRSAAMRISATSDKALHMERND